MNAEATGNRIEPTELDRRLAAPMFFVALASLMMAGALFHLTDFDFGSRLSIALIVGIGITHLAMFVETVLQWRAGGRQMRQHLYYCLMPMSRFCPHDHANGQSAWVPMLGWKKRNDRLEIRLARLFGGPMILIALLVLPVVGVEFLLDKQMAAHYWFKFTVDTVAGFIWMAFVFEFVVMISVVEKKFNYCRSNWIDLAIVLLPIVIPVFSYYVGAARLGRLVKLKQLTRTAKIYRMRGLALRGWRAIVALDVINKVMRRKPEYHAERLVEEIAEKEREIKQLKIELTAIRKRIRNQERQRNQDRTNREGTEMLDEPQL